MLNILPLPAEELIQYVNYFFLAVIAIFAIIGFFRGTLKSAYYGIATLVIFVGGWLLMDLAIDSLLYLDLSSLGQNIDGIPLTTPMEFISKMILESNPEMEFIFNEDSYSLALAEGVVGIIFKIVYFIVLVILSFTLLYVFTGFTWLIMRKPLRRMLCKPYKKNRKGKPKYKKRFLSRVGGFGLGACKGLLYTLLIGFILAGLASVSDSVQSIAGGETEEVAVVVTNDTMTLVKLNSQSNEETESPLAEYQDVLDLISGYRQTVPGQVFGAIKFGEDKVTFDEYVFDTIFSIEGKNGEVKLRKELKTVAQAFSSDSVQSIMTDGFDVSKLHELPEEDLKQLMDTISSLDLIKVVAPVGIEFIAYSSVLEEALGENYDDVYKLIEDNLDELLAIDYCEEVRSLGYIFVDVVDLLGEDISDLSNLDYLSLDQETIDSIFASLDELEILEVVAPVTITYLLNSDSVKEAIEEAGFTLEDLGLTEDIDYVDELMNLPNIYEKFVDLGIKVVDGEINMTEVDIEKIKPFVESLFDSVIISNAVPVVATTLATSYLPDEYNGIFTAAELEGINWEEEFDPLLSAVVSLMKTGILDSEDPVQTLCDMSDEDFNKLGVYLSKSKLVTENLNDILDILFDSLDLGDIQFESLDSEQGEVWNETEIVSLFKSVKVVLDSGIIGSEDYMTALSDISNEDIEKLAESLSSSTFMKKNINNLVASLMSEVGFDFAQLTKDEWTKNEIYSVFKSVQIMASTVSEGEISAEVILNLSSSDLAIILESEFIKQTLKNFIVKEAKAGGQLEILKGVYENGADEYNNVLYYWDDVTEETNVKLEGTILKITEVAGALEYIVYKNNVYYLSTKDELNIDLASLTPQEDYTYTSEDVFTVKAITENGELRKVFNAISCLEISNLESFDIDLRQVVNKRDTLLASYIVTETLIDQIRLQDNDNAGGILNIPDEYEVGGTGQWRGADGELNNAIDALDLLLGISSSETPVTINSISADNIGIKNIIEHLDTIYDSEIMTATIVHEIQKLGEENVLVVPNEYQGDYKLWTKADGTDELGHLLLDLEYILDLPDRGFSVDPDNINLKSVMVHKDDILQSAVLTATLADAVIDLSGDNTIIIPDEYKLADHNWATDYSLWKNTYYDGTLVSHGELSLILNAIDLIIGISSSADDIKVEDLSSKFESISIKNVIEQEDEILKSAVLTATLTDKIVDLGNDDTIIIPDEYKLNGNSWSTDYAAWKNSYTNEVIVSHGELSNVLDSIDLIIGISSSADDVTIDDLTNKFNNISIKNVLANEDEILKSVVLTATLTDKIVDLGNDNTIVIPDEFKLTGNSWETDYQSWKNTYNNDSLVSHGELSGILESIDLIIGISSSADDVTIDDLTSKFNDISIKNVINNEEEILKSAILTATLVDKIVDLGGDGTIQITSDYAITDTTWANGYNKWKNTYENGVLTTKGELTFMLNSLDKLLGISSSVDDVTINDLTSKLSSIYIKDIQNNKDDILLSHVIATTIAQKVIALNGNGLVLPSEYISSYALWLNEYDNNYQVVKDGEVAKLLTSLSVLISDDSATIDNLNFDSFELKNFTSLSNRDKVLYSNVLSYTLKDRLIDLASDANPAINLPDNYNVEGSANYFVWENTYNNDGTVNTKGELSYILGAIDLIIGNATLNDFSSLNFTNLFSLETNGDGIIPQDEIMKSKVISETIIRKLTTGNGDAIKVPSGLGLENTLDRSAWVNQYNGGTVVRKELANAINALGLMIPNNQKSNLSDIDLYNTIDNALSIFKEDGVEKETILTSYVVCETLKGNMFAINAIKDNIQEAFDINYGVGADANDRTKWYELDTNGKPKQLELWNLLTGVSILLGNQGLTTSGEFDIKTLTSNTEMIPVYNATTFEVTESKIEEMLKSIVLEHIFAEVAVDLIENKLSSVINAPEGGFKWYKKTATVEHDLKTFLESYYIVQQYIGLDNIQQYSNLDNITSLTSAMYQLLQLGDGNHDEQLADLGAGMVISRSFKGSIAKMYNLLFYPYYQYKVLTNPSMSPWEEVMFDQNDYNGTKEEAHDNFMETYKKICTELN